MTAILLMLSLALPAEAADQANGRSVYAAKCQACHGAEGKGNGPAAIALPSPPPDMTTEAFWRGRTDEKLEASITSGSPKGVMRGFPMREDQLADLIAYLRTFEP